MWWISSTTFFIISFSVCLVSLDFSIYNLTILDCDFITLRHLAITSYHKANTEADYSGYPDCRAVFVRSQQKTIRLALEWPVKIVTPFMNMSKADEWALAEQLGILDIIENETLTCYNGIPGSGCKKCPACVLRNRGYSQFRKASESH